MLELGALIRDIPDFPKKGILFKDITTLLKDPQAFKESIDRLTEMVRGYQPEVVIGMESRGFIFAAPIAYLLGAGFVPVRKLGKLPGEVVSTEYELEYGTNTLELHRDAVQRGQRVLIVDDLLATGGTVSATIQLVEKLHGQVVTVAFLVELLELRGRERLQKYDVLSLIKFSGRPSTVGKGAASCRYTPPGTLGILDSPTPRSCSSAACTLACAPTAPS